MADLKKSTPITLPSEVAAEFELINWVGGHRQDFGRFGIVDLERITLAQANRLVNQGFSKLQRKVKPEKAQIAKAEEPKSTKR